MSPRASPYFRSTAFGLGIVPFSSRQFPVWWQTLSLGRRLLPNSKLEAVLLTFPPYSTENVTFVVDGKRRDLVWVVPICASELEFCQTNGIEAFEEVLERTNIDIADIFREAIASGGPP